MELGISTADLAHCLRQIAYGLLDLDTCALPTDEDGTDSMPAVRQAIEFGMTDRGLAWPTLTNAAAV
ncbi:MAG: hypothetical protein AB7I33_01580 [Gemmatimonadales bacterium]